MREIMNFTSAKDAMEWATIIAKSKFCPKEFFNHPESVLVAIAYGAELGLKPLQALQNICVINGKPSIYGDAMLAVCKNSPDFETIEEELVTENGQFMAVCSVKRKNQPIVTVKFTSKDAEVAGLYNRPGPWKQYPKRMLQMRARSFALRDCFPDVLKGMIAVEEAQDYKIEKDATVIQQQVDNVLAHQAAKDFNDCVLTDKLYELLLLKKPSDELCNKWLQKAGANRFEDMSADVKQKLITHLEQMETPNGQN